MINNPTDSRCIIELENVNITLPHNTHNDLKQTILNIIRKKNSKKSGIKICNNLTIRFEPGDRVGILGPNGAGKSSFLKLISSIYPPDTGKVKVTGSLFPLIELGVGFNPELTGEENVYLYASLCGMTREAIESKIDDIFEFAELNNFRKELIKHYSSGMYARLAFSVATCSVYDIMLLDEVFATGDIRFAQKALGKLNELLTKTKIVILVSHDLNVVKDYCNRFIWLEKGKVVNDTRDAKMIDDYKQHQLSG